jgi:L-iditol 2-dehydrogenase
VQLDWDAAMTKVLTLYFNMSTEYAGWDKTIQLVAQGKLDLKTLITHRFPLTEWEKGFAAAENMEALKVLFVP